MRIRDGKNSDLGSGINIPDPQHCCIHVVLYILFIIYAGGSHLFTPEVFLEDLKNLAAAPEEE